jgi:hypothetical protein
MLTLIAQGARIAAAGDKAKLINEYINLMPNARHARRMEYSEYRLI